MSSALELYLHVHGDILHRLCSDNDPLMQGKLCQGNCTQICASQAISFSAKALPLRTLAVSTAGEQPNTEQL